MREQITAEVLVPSLLHSDMLVRTAAASLAFDVSTVLQKSRVEAVKGGRGIKPYRAAEGGFADWEVEMVSAVIEALDREKENEEVGKCSKFTFFPWSIIFFGTLIFFFLASTSINGCSSLFLTSVSAIRVSNQGFIRGIADSEITSR